MTEFDDMTKRILDKLDSFDSKIDDLCARMIKVEYDLQGHFDEIDKRSENKDRKFYIIIALLATSFAAFEIFQSVL